MAGVYTDQRLNLSKLGKAFGSKPRWDCEPVLQSKEQERKPLTYSGARPISIPVDLSSRQTQYVVKDLGDWETYQLQKLFRSCRWRCTRKREVLSESRMREIRLSGCVSSEGWHVQQETNLPG